MHLRVVPQGPRSPFRSQRAFNNLLEAILSAPGETFVGFCLHVGLLGLKPTELSADEPAVVEAPLVSEPSGLLTNVVGEDILAS